LPENFVRQAVNTNILAASSLALQLNIRPTTLLGLTTDDYDELALLAIDLKLLEEVLKQSRRRKRGVRGK